VSSGIGFSVIVMGNQISSSIHYFLTPQECPKVLFYGLDASGKTTILLRLQFKNDQDRPKPSATVGFNVATVTTERGYRFTGWDVGGGDKIRPLWRHYYHMMSAFLFVIDSNDIDRFDMARNEFHRMINEEGLKGHPVLVLCNKQDLPNAMSTSEICDKLGLTAIMDRRIIVAGCVATTGDGLEEGLFFLSRTLQSMKYSIPCNEESNDHQPDNDIPTA
jgi:ADP-ribosylation factor 1/2